MNSSTDCLKLVDTFRLPGISAFPELNVRLYVERDGKPGVWFLSLDASNRLAVWTARRFFHLPYFHAWMGVTYEAERVVYRSHRRVGPSAVFEAQYRPRSEPYAATPGTLDHWLTERYCLYAVSRRGDVSRTEVHHHPWPLQRAEAEIMRNEMLAPHGLSVGAEAPLLHFSRRLDVVVWSPKVVSR